MNNISVQLNTNYSALFLSDKNVRLPSPHLANLPVKTIQPTHHHHHHPIHTFHEGHVGKPGQANVFLKERALWPGSLKNIYHTKKDPIFLYISRGAIKPRTNYSKYTTKCTYYGSMCSFVYSGFK